jgi:hypothetical protein
LPCFEAPREDVGELRRRFLRETANRVAALQDWQRERLAAIRAYVFGEGVDTERVRAADQLVVCGDRDAMLLTFLERKKFDVEATMKAFDNILTWRWVAWMACSERRMFGHGRLVSMSQDQGGRGECVHHCPDPAL